MPELNCDEDLGCQHQECEARGQSEGDFEGRVAESENANDGPARNGEAKHETKYVAEFPMHSCYGDRKR